MRRIATVLGLLVLAGLLIAQPVWAEEDRPMPTSRGERVVELAREQIGRPYLWGGTDPANGFDCSGLVTWVYANADVTVPRTTGEQWRLLPDVSEPFPALGDLVYFVNTENKPGISHVGIISAPGKMIHAVESGVQESSLSTWYWFIRWAGWRRPGG